MTSEAPSTFETLPFFESEFHYLGSRYIKDLNKSSGSGDF